MVYSGLRHILQPSFVEIQSAVGFVFFVTLLTDQFNKPGKGLVAYWHLNVEIIIHLIAFYVGSHSGVGQDDSYCTGQTDKLNFRQQNTTKE